MKLLENARRITKNIAQSGLTIHDPINKVDKNLWLSDEELELILNEGLMGLSLKGMANRTRSKFVKEVVCRVLGYPVPKSFKKTQPRFVGQDFDTYVQKSNNLQIHNEEISTKRRYVLIKQDEETGLVSRVKVVTGEYIAKLDTTGTKTKKYQARLVVKSKTSELIAHEDTLNLKGYTQAISKIDLSKVSPVDYPSSDSLLCISTIYDKLSPLVGSKFTDLGSDQERNRGAELHRLVCEQLGYGSFKDHGQFPDIRHQLLEVKLQTSPTIDLGLVLPDSEEVLKFPFEGENRIRHRDVRYALFYATISHGQVELTNFYLTTGEKFFTRFPQFQGKVINEKLQIPLPKDFWL